MPDFDHDPAAEPGALGPAPKPEDPAASPSNGPVDLHRLVGPIAEPSMLEAWAPLRWAWSDSVRVDAEVGRSRDMTFSVFNDDARPRELSSVTVADSRAFRVLAASSRIPPKGHTQITVGFEPFGERTEYATLVVTPVRGDVLTMRMAGVGTAPKRTAQPSQRPVHSHQAQPDAPLVDNGKNTWRLEGPTRIDLGDNLVNARTTHSTSVFALDREQGPRIRARVVGDAAITLKQAPLFLPGAKSPYDASNEFMLEHAPSKRDTSTSILEVEVLDAPYETFRYPIVARAHEPGEPTHEEEHAASREKEQERRRAAESEATRRHNDRLGQQRGSAHRFVPEDLRDFNDARDSAKDALRDVFDFRLNGIAVAGREIGEFARRKPPREQPSRIEQLAWMALDLAAASFAGGIAKAMEPVVAKILSHTTNRGTEPSWQDPLGESGVVVSTPSQAIVGAITDGVKHIVKSGLKKGEDGAQVGADVVDEQDPTSVATAVNGQTYATASSNPEAAYLAVQSDSLILSRGTAISSVVSAYKALWPTFHVDPRGAVKAMIAIGNGLREERERANAIQAEQTVRKWVQYVAESAGAAQATRTFSEDNPLEARDGLIDVTVAADQARPEQRVKVVDARIDGVRHDVVKRLRKQRLLDLGLPVRASTNFGSPSLSLTVTRQAGGQVDFAEDTTQQGRAQWLARKAAAAGKGPDPFAGARLLMEDEVMSRTLVGVPVHNDSVERHTKRK